MLSSYMQYFFTDRFVRILNFGEIYPRQASAFESNLTGFE